MFKRHFFIIVAGAVVALMLVAALLKITLGGNDAQGGPGGPGGRGGRGGGQEVAVTSPISREFADQLKVLGVARSLRSVNITSSTSELVTRVLFTDGQQVAAGTALVELQAREEDAAIISARAELTQAQREYDRYQILSERGVAPRVLAEQAETRLQTARAAVSAAEARRGDRVLRAPFSGVLGLSTVTAGTLISPGTVITTLDDLSSVRVDFAVPERYLGNLRSGTPLTATSDAYPGETFSGRIALMDVRVNEQTRAVTARAEFPNPGGRIRPGMMMRVAVERGQRQALAVPEAAVQYEGAGAFVYRLAGADNGTIAQRVEVETGTVENGFVEIVSGLGGNDRIVSSGLNRIQPGAPVREAGTGGNGRGRAAPAAGAAPAKAAAR
ncbi:MULTISPECIES: efflux RND transporter periplasmic adaptor subunit [unclassified Brevundimonas]|uniref:efflux RND transporter periplasmic adaptor subunit n=1 Tax=unclassified Brevundimonas TaxID=2622653 RepID=UPI0025BA7383|nr:MULTISPECIES: efflux RND transporter periplasmic adaptor subunit [unclassified Brevundimonas]